MQYSSARRSLTNLDINDEPMSRKSSELDSAFQKKNKRKFDRPEFQPPLTATGEHMVQK